MQNQTFRIPKQLTQQLQSLCVLVFSNMYHYKFHWIITSNVKVFCTLAQQMFSNHIISTLGSKRSGSAGNKKKKKKTVQSERAYERPKRRKMAIQQRPFVSSRLCEESIHTAAVGKVGLTAAAGSFNESVCGGEKVSLKPYWRATSFHPRGHTHAMTHTDSGDLTILVTSSSSSPFFHSFICG